MYYSDSFGVETPPLFLEEYVDLGSNERIQQYDESYGGAYCLYMIYIIDRGFRMNNALNILVNQCKYPGIYECLGCNVNDKYNVYQGTCFADDNVNDNDNDLRSSFANNDNANDLRSSFANNHNDNDSLIYLFDVKHQRHKPIIHSSYTDPRSLLIHVVATSLILVTISLQI